MANPLLFQPFTLRDLEIRNRLWVAPMCQYSAVGTEGSDAGVPSDWHVQHLGALGVGGAGLVIVEATGVLPEGRITPSCLGLWNDTQKEAFARIVPKVKAHGARVGIQLAHAGRKASTNQWVPGGPKVHSLAPDEGGWQPVGPSEVAYGHYVKPRELSTEEVREVITAFITATNRAVEAGFEVVEIHAAHGYLLHSFLSPLSNFRDDEYGGSPEGRAKPLREIVRGMRQQHPELPIIVRVSADEWAPGGFDVEACAQLVSWLQEDGVDMVDASSGGNVPSDGIAVGPGYQVKLADRLRHEGLPIGAVGLITTPEQAESILVTGQADVISLGRPLLVNPHLPISWAHQLRATDAADLIPPQFWRARWGGSMVNLFSS